MARPANVLWFAAALLVSGCGLAALYFNVVVALHLFLGIFFYAIIYTVSDSTLLRSIGQYRAQGKDKAGKVVQLVQ